MEHLDNLFKNIVTPVQSKTAAVRASISVSEVKTEMNQMGFPEKKETIIKDEKVKLEEKLITGRPMYISVDYGFTKNMGNFNSAKVAVSISRPVGIEFTPEIVKELRDKIAETQKICEEIVGKEMDDLERVRNGK